VREKTNSIKKKTAVMNVVILVVIENGLISTIKSIKKTQVANTVSSLRFNMFKRQPIFR